jgi:hypothetical protein
LRDSCSDRPTRGQHLKFTTQGSRVRNRDTVRKRQFHRHPISSAVGLPPRVSARFIMGSPGMPISVLGSCPSSKGEAERNIAYFVAPERKGDLQDSRRLHRGQSTSWRNTSRLSGGYGKARLSVSHSPRRLWLMAAGQSRGEPQRSGRSRGKARLRLSGFSLPHQAPQQFEILLITVWRQIDTCRHLDQLLLLESSSHAAS